MDPRVSLALRRRRPRPIAAAVLASELGLAPPRLAAAVEELARLGFVIESHPHQGLRLVAAPEALLAEEIACDLAVARIGRRIECVEAAASTNDLAWQAAARGRDEADGLAVFAEHQTAGRGRRGNVWLAPPRSSLLVSVVVWVPHPPAQGGILTRATAVAAAEAIEENSDLAVGIKWPNDLVIEDRKVGGILVEARPIAGAMGPVVVGIGLNCTQGAEAFPPEIRSAVASLAMFGDPPDRTLLARSLLERLDRAVALTVDTAGAAEVCRSASQRCRTLGRRITVQEGGVAYTGEVIGLDPDYGLVLRLAEGGIRRFHAMTAHVKTNAK